MAATFAWQQHSGAGPDLTTPTHFNWLNSTDPTDAYGDFPITPGEFSYENWIFGKFSGTFTEIRSGLFAHTATAFNADETLWGAFCMWSVADIVASSIWEDYGLVYRTPVKTRSASTMAWNLTPVKSITDVDKDHDGDPGASVDANTGAMVVYFGATGPDGATLKRAWSADATAYTNYLTTQLGIGAGHGGGDTATVTLTLRYDEL